MGAYYSTGHFEQGMGAGSTFDGFDPHSTWNPSQAPGKITATPFIWRDPKTLPRREWLYGRHLIRKFVSATVAAGGIGKSSLVVAEALAMVTGKPLLGVTPTKGPHRVWLVNLEDPQEEIDTRIIGAMMFHKITPEDVGDRLYADSGRRFPLPFRIATTTKNGIQVATPLVENLVAEIKRRRIDVLVIDPFVKAHEVSENDNMAIDKVATAFAEIADKTGCAIELVHHVRKAHGDEVRVEDGRGAGALLGAVRSARSLSPMTKAEADKIGVDPQGLFRTIVGKSNLAPPTSSSWFQMRSVTIGNGEHEDDAGDLVGVTVAWDYPSTFDGITVADLRACQSALSGRQWRESDQSPEWWGLPVAKVLHLDVDDAKDKARLKAILRIWLKNEMFRVVKVADDKGRPRPFVEVYKLAID